MTPNLFEFSEDINLASDTAVISFTLILKKLIGKNKQTAVLHLADDPPMILGRAIQLLLSLPDQTFSYTQDTKVFLQKHNQSKMIFCSNFHRVNGMEFDHVVIVLRQLEYYLKYYLPQAISRCNYDLNFVLLPKDKTNTQKSFWQNFRSLIFQTAQTVAHMMEELKRNFLVNQVLVVECKACENNSRCYSISNGADDKEKFEVHTHSDEYHAYTDHLENYEVDEQTHNVSAGALDEAK